jgi:hypothetical protein
MITDTILLSKCEDCKKCKVRYRVQIKSFFDVTVFVSVIIICIMESGNRGIKQGLPPTNIYIITRSHYRTILFKDE